MENKKVALIILDGWGHGRNDDTNAVYKAHTPFVDSLYSKYTHARLLTSGEDVGLPEGQMGNSEVGHLNIGAGRVVYQDLVKLNKAIRDKTFFSHHVLLETFEYTRRSGKKLHLIGLVSDGGVHSHIEHLKALCTAAKLQKVDKVFIHAFTDGRDTDPKGGLAYMENLSAHCAATGASIATVTGRYFAMDRDRRWERVRIAYDALVHGIGTPAPDAMEGIRQSYENGITDEFIKPIVITGNSGQPLAKIEEGDAVICFNFRTDRCREITMALTQQDFHEHNMHRMNLHYVTMTNYDDTFKNVRVVYDKDNLVNTLGEIISKAGKTQLRIAETEKYPHVTFFFSGGRENVFEGEERIMVPSPKVATYDLQPEMSAIGVTDEVCKKLIEGRTDFICLNFANPDMVGHTGVFRAVVTAVETVDQCLRRVVETGLKTGYSFIITADHGNADFMINDDGSPNTAHTTNPVPVILIDDEYREISNGRLCDLAPTVLMLLGIGLPAEMTGQALVTPVQNSIRN